jgi:phosphate acyltransferase
LLRFGLDAMGGDHAPREIVRGAVDAVPHLNGHQLVLFGDETAIRQELERLQYGGKELQIVHTSQVIAMDESPVDAVRGKKDSSICRMVQMAAARELNAVISAGNTGAFAAASHLRMRMLPGASRAGIAVVMPTFQGPVVLCDAGSNLSPKPRHFVEYAIMAGGYSRHVLKVERPRIGLLSVGEEEAKGTTLVQQSHELLRHTPGINFVGNIEGRDLFRGSCDVVICDGFTGNIALKLTEGLAEGLYKTISNELALASPELAEKVAPVVKRVWAIHDYSEYGGAPLLGVDGVCIICHGRSDHVAIRNAVRVARQYCESDLNTIIAAELASAPLSEPAARPKS